MFELTFYFYIKHEIGFYDWVKKQDPSKVNDTLPQGIQFIGILKPLFGDVRKLQAKLHLDDMSLVGKIHEAYMQPGFLNELQSYIDYNRVVKRS